jgi:hypothetical protein
MKTNKLVSRIDLCEPIGINIRGVEYFGIDRVAFNINQCEFIQ